MSIHKTPEHDPQRQENAPRYIAVDVQAEGAKIREARERKQNPQGMKSKKQTMPNQKTQGLEIKPTHHLPSTGYTAVDVQAEGAKIREARERRQRKEEALKAEQEMQKNTLITHERRVKPVNPAQSGNKESNIKVTTHTVQAGEGLWTIAKKHNPLVPATEIVQLVQQIVKLNDLGSSKALIAPGQILKVPSIVSNNKKQSTQKALSKIEANIKILELKIMGHKSDHTRVFQPPVFEGKPASKNKNTPKTTSGKQKTTTQKNASTSLNWLKYIKQGKVTDKNLLKSIESARKRIPNHSKKLMTTSVGFRGHVYYGTPKQGKPDPIPTSLKGSSSIKDKAQKAVWKELEKEGGTSSINTYDDQIFTWGRGFSGKTFLKGILQDLLSSNASIKEKFTSVGIGVDANNNIMVIDTKSGNITSGNAALYLIRSDTRLMSFFIEVGENKSTKQASADAQWKVISKNAGNIPDFVYDAKTNQYKDKWSDDAVALCAHFEHWLPAGGWRVFRSSYERTKGDLLEIIKVFSSLIGESPYAQHIVGKNQKSGTYLACGGTFPFINYIIKFANGKGFSVLQSKWTLVKGNIQEALKNNKNQGLLFIPYNGKHYSIKIK